MDKTGPREETYKWHEALDDAMADSMDQIGAVVPPIPDLLIDAEMIEEASKKWSDDPDLPPISTTETTTKIRKSLMDMIEEITPTSAAPEPKIKKTTLKKPNSKTKPVITPEPSTKPESEIALSTSIDHEDSYTSQQETAALREDVEHMAQRIKHLESTLEIVLKERSQLPVHILKIKEDMNAQLTLISEKFYAALEAGSIGPEAASAVQKIAETQDHVTNVMTVISKDLNTEPRLDSSVVSSKPIPSKPQRVRLIK